MEIARLPEYSSIVIDTNFLIDLFSKQELYKDIIESLRRKNCSLVSIDLVRCEFIRSKNRDIVKAKSEVFNKIIESLLPIDTEVQSLVQPTIEAYGNDIEKVALTDIYLACVIERYQGVYLLTRNHIDFPLRLFTRTEIFNIQTDKDIKTYALYQYKGPKVINITETEVIPF